MGPVRGEGGLGVVRVVRRRVGEPPGAAGVRRRYGAAVVVGLFQLLIATDISGMRGGQELLFDRGVRRVSAWGRGREALALVLVRVLVLRHDMRIKNGSRCAG